MITLEIIFAALIGSFLGVAWMYIVAHVASAIMDDFYRRRDERALKKVYGDKEEAA